MRTNFSTKSICVIIPTFNRAGYLRILLEQLFCQENNENYTLIPVVVVDGSTDGTNEMLEAEYPKVQVLKGSGKWWWTKSINEGIKYALPLFHPEYILLLNDDSQIEPGYLHSLSAAAASAGENTIIGSISVTDKTPSKVSFAGVKSINWVTLKKKNYYKSFEPLENIPASGLFPTYALNGRGTFMKSSIIEDLNFLNERSFPQYGSDDDLALRAWKKGYKVLIANSCKIIDRAADTSKGTAYRQDSLPVFLKSFISWNSVNYIPKQLLFFYFHGIKILLPFYFAKFLLGTSYAYFFKYKKLKYEI